MTVPNPTVEDATKHKSDLETTISNAMTHFGKLTGLTVECVNVEITDSRLEYEEDATTIKGVKITYEVEATVEL